MVGGGSVALDIGAGHGALIVRAPASRVGEEIEVVSCPGGLRTHVAVQARAAGGRTMHAAVFGSLPAGVYRLVGAAERTVVIRSGSITRLRVTGPG